MTLLARTSLAWLLSVAAAFPASAQPAPGLRLELRAGPVPALLGDPHSCTPPDTPDAPARALRLGPGSVQLYASDQINRVDRGPDLRQLRHDCTIVLRGAGLDDPGAYDDHEWIATPWIDEGQTIWAIVHDEFHGHTRKALCPTGRYMDCWYNALTLAVSSDHGQSFHRAPGNALVAALPYRYDEVGLGHHGYFNPTNIVSFDGQLHMFAFVTRANAQRAGNCLLRTDRIDRADSWLAWDGTAYATHLVSSYAGTVQPEHHLCAPVAPQSLRWPVTSLVRHEPSGLFLALMQDTSRAGGVFYATSPDLLHWSAPARLIAVSGLSGWQCGDPQPIAYPSILDPASRNPNFQSVGATATMFATRFEGDDCRIAGKRSLIRWDVQIAPDAK